MKDPASYLSGTELRVCQMIAERQMRGVAKYGTTVSANPLTLREWLQHALEESLDHAIYLRRAIEELDNQPKPFKDVNGLIEAFEKEIRKQ